jgi:hypothetical protein
MPNPGSKSVDLVARMLAAAVLGGGGSALAATFTLELVDSGGISDVGRPSSVAVDAQGNPRIAYHDQTGENLKYASRDGGAWSIEVVDFAGSVGAYTSLKLDAQGNPRISYYERNFDRLRYAARSGGVWMTEPVDQGGLFTTSIALDAAGRPHISYYDDINHDVRYAFHDGAGWIRTTVDSVGVVGPGTSLAIDSLGDVHIAYLDDTNKDLKYAVLSAGTWTVQVADAVGQRGWDPSLALDAQGYPHVSYYALSGGNLRYATAAPLATSGPDVVSASTLPASQPWPNPAVTDGALSMYVEIPRSEDLSLELFDVAGRRIAVMPPVKREAGPQIVSWRPPATAPGVYFVRLQTGSGLSVERRWIRVR